MSDQGKTPPQHVDLVTPQGNTARDQQKDTPGPDKLRTALRNEEKRIRARIDTPEKFAETPQNTRKLPKKAPRTQKRKHTPEEVRERNTDPKLRNLWRKFRQKSRRESPFYSKRRKKQNREKMWVKTPQDAKRQKAHTQGKVTPTGREMRDVKERERNERGIGEKWATGEESERVQTLSSSARTAILRSRRRIQTSAQRLRTLERRFHTPLTGAS